MSSAKPQERVFNFLENHAIKKAIEALTDNKNSNSQKASEFAFKCIQVNFPSFTEQQILDCMTEALKQIRLKADLLDDLEQCKAIVSQYYPQKDNPIRKMLLFWIHNNINIINFSCQTGEEALNVIRNRHQKAVDSYSTAKGWMASAHEMIQQMYAEVLS